MSEQERSISSSPEALQELKKMKCRNLNRFLYQMSKTNKLKLVILPDQSWNIWIRSISERKKKQKIVAISDIRNETNLESR
jgi:hypothetical protein